MVTVPLLLVGEYTVYKDGVVGADKVGATVIMKYSLLGKSSTGASSAATMSATMNATMAATASK